MRIVGLVAVCLIGACAPVGAPSLSQAPLPSATIVAPNATGTAPEVFTMPTDRDMISFAADRGALIAFSTHDGPPPYDSKVQRADPTATVWRTVYRSDSLFSAGRAASGRVALAEYREPFQGGGAYSVDVTVVDLVTGTTMAIDRFALSSATYRGGGGAPRRPVGSVILGPERVAWTRLTEGPGGSVTGELRVALIADPGRAAAIASSAEWIAPLGLDAHQLLYVIGGKTEDQLHIRDLDTGVDRIVVTGTVGDPQRDGVPGFNAAVLAGDWAVWLDTPRSATGRIRAVDVVTGADRIIDAGGSSCSQPSAGTRYVAWYCSAAVGGILDARTLAPVLDLSVGTAPVASDDALVWFTAIPNGRTVTLFRPR